MSNDKIKVKLKNPDKASQGASRLFFPCTINSPSDGDPGGKPYPKKSSAVKAMILAVRINGSCDKLEANALGKMCLSMI